MKFDRKIAKQLSVEIEAALNEVAAHHGIKIMSKGGRFNPQVFTLKLELVAPSEDGQVQTSEEAAWKNWAVLYGFKPEDLGREFRSNGTTYTIAGVKPKAHKFPILARRADGKMFKFPVENVKIAMNRNAVEAGNY